MRLMSTTDTLDSDNDAAARRLIRVRGLTFSQAVNEAIRRGLSAGSDGPAFRTPTFSMGPPRMPVGKALRLAAELEDQEAVRRLAPTTRTE
jgi:hypothetical protein